MEIIKDCLDYKKWLIFLPFFACAPLPLITCVVVPSLVVFGLFGGGYVGLFAASIAAVGVFLIEFVVFNTSKQFLLSLGLEEAVRYTNYDPLINLFENYIVTEPAATELEDTAPTKPNASTVEQNTIQK
mgnify:CR=1 FL=1